MKSIGAVLLERERSLLVGREAERRVVAAWLQRDRATPSILKVTGPGGVGKSVLLRAVQREAEGAGWRTVLVDAATFPPTEEALREALVRAAGSDDWLDELNRPRSLLLIDSFEELRTLGSHVQEEILARLQTGVRVAIGGRYPLGPSWAAFAPFVWTIDLGGLTREEASDYLARRGIDCERTVDAIVRRAGGHPLALSLAADLAERFGVRSLAGGPQWRLTVRSLVEELLRDVPDPRLRRALVAVSVVRQFDESLLAAMLGEDESAAIFPELSMLSAIRPTIRGLAVHQLVRPVLLEDLHWRRSDRQSELRARALAHYRHRATLGSRQEREWALAELAFLSEDTVLQALVGSEREAEADVYVEPARPEERDEVLGVVRAWRSALEAGTPSTPHPDSVEEMMCRATDHLGIPGVRMRVARESGGRIVGLSCVIALSEASAASLVDSPVFGPLLAQAFGAYEVAAEARGARAPAVSCISQIMAVGERREGVEVVLFRDLFGVLSEGGVFVAAARTPTFAAMLEACGFRPIGGSRPGPASERGYLLDLAGVGMEAWLDALVAGTRPPRRLRGDALVRELEAVLKAWDDPGRLARSPLAEMGGAVGTAPSDRADAVRRLVLEAVAAGGGANELRALELAYLRPAPSLERAADRMSVSRATFYRLRRRGIELLALTIRDGVPADGPAPAD